MIRQPIVSVLGHIDHGKTTLLDSIRGSAVTAKEAGGITQHIGATEIPIDTIKNVCGPLLNNLSGDLKIPGLLFIDTPGHAAFTNLRKRGGAISDLGVLIVDITEGFKPQTYEALKVLSSYKTPFLLVANKIDKVPGWQSNPEKPILSSINSQNERVQTEINTKIYELIEILHENGFGSERFDRVSDFSKQVAIVPMSALTKEGIPAFLMVLAGLTQKYLEDRLEVNVEGPGEGSILEVRQTQGLGTTLDVILYNGCIKKGDTIVFTTANGPASTDVKALLRPAPLEEIRLGKNFKQVDEVYAAAGVKIAAPGLDDALSGSPLLVVGEGMDVEGVKSRVQKEIDAVQFTKENIGAVVKADTLGSLEALVKMLSEEGIEVRKAGFGAVTKADVMEAEAVRKEDPLKAVIFAFNVGIMEGMGAEAERLGIKIIKGDIIYSLIDEYKAWLEAKQNRTVEQLLQEVTLPAKLFVMPGFVFRQSKPAVCGVRIDGGVLKPKTEIMTAEGKVIGTAKEVQKENESVEKAVKGDEVAISITGAVVGRSFKEGDTLYVSVPTKDKDIIKAKLSNALSPDTLEVLNELEEGGI